MSSGSAKETEGELWPVQASDGHRFDVLVERPAAPRAAVLFVAALGIEASYYEDFASAMARCGVAFAVCDLRGNGTSNVRPSREVDFGYREIVELDIPAAITVVRERLPDTPLFIGGHSLGGQLAVLHVAAERPQVAGITLVACAIPFYKAFEPPQRWQVLLLTVLFPIAGAILGYVPGKRLGFGGTEARTLMRDWAHNARTGRYEPAGSGIDYERALGDVDTDLITVNIRGDEMGPVAAVEHMAGKVPNARSQRVEAGLSEPKPGAHFRWARDSAEVVAALTDWIEEKVTGM